MKTKAQIKRTVIVQLISAYVFTTKIVHVQSPYFINPKFQASSHLLWLYSPTCVDLIRNPKNRFSNDEAQLSEASVEKEDDHKFMYVMKGPARAKQKKVFYVYGKGWGAKDGAVVKPTATKEMGQDPTWPLRQHPNDVYYDIRVLDHGNMLLLLSFWHKTTFNGPS